jgi:hypothetical protein
MNYKQHLQKDLNFGLPNEELLLPLIRRTFDATIKRTTNRNFVFDYEGVDTYAELKTRRIYHNQFDDIMIGKNKLDFALNCGKDVFFCYSLIDGNYYYKFSKEDISNQGITFREGGRQDRGKDERKKCGFIKTNLLKKF